MIVFEVRSDGTVVSTPSLVAQGTSLSDLVVLADADYSLVTMHFTHPSGIYIPDIVFTPTHTQGRSLWQAVMPPEISRISGAVTYQIFLTSADGKTLATPTGRITVQEGVISNMPETAEELGQYSISALYQLMANFYASLEGYRQTLDGLTVKTHKWTILASDWTDSTPYQATIVFPHGNYAKPGTLILVAPADNRSREQIEKGELTVTVHDSGVIGSAPVVDTAVIVRGGKAPTEDINLVLFFIDTQGEDEPLTQWIGIDMGSILPEVTPEDYGKVLTVDKNGDVAWGDPQGMKVYEITSPEEIKADSHDGLYIQEGGTSTPSGGTTIHYYDSLEQVPADLPEGSYVAVPSEGDTKVIDLTQYSDASQGQTFNNLILYLFTSGGGTINIADAKAFWDDVNTNKKIVFMFDGSALISGFTVEITPTLIGRIDGAVNNVVATLQMFSDWYSNTGTLYFNRISVNEYNFTLAVVVTQTNVPTPS